VLRDAYPGEGQSAESRGAVAEPQADAA